MNLVEEKIKENLTDLKIQTNDYCWIWAWSSFASSWSLGIILIIVLAVNSATEDFVGIPILICFPVGIILCVIFVVKGILIRKSNLKKLASKNSRFHEIYFNYFQHLFPQNLQFEGIFSDENSNCHSLNFSFGLEKIIWQIGQVYAGGYIINYSLTSTAKKIAGFDLITISEQKESQDLFKFESVEFTKRFKIEGTNPIQIYKLLNPKIIDNFLKQKVHFLEPKMIQIYDGVASIEWGGAKSSLSWAADPMDFSKIHWTKRKMTEEIFKKVEVDFARFLENQKLLEPLNLYENN